MPRPDDPRLKALAELVHQLHPTWNRGGILSAIHACQRPGRDLSSIIRAAVDAALDPDARTPAVICHRDGAAWTPHTVTTSPPERRACPTCRDIHMPDQTTCHRPSQDPAAGARAVREALKALS